MGIFGLETDSVIASAIIASDPEGYTRDFGELFGFEEPEDPTPPPDPGAALSEAEEEAKRKNDERRRRISEGGRQTTIHAIGRGGRETLGDSQTLGST